MCHAYDPCSHAQHHRPRSNFEIRFQCLSNFHILYQIFISLCTFVHHNRTMCFNIIQVYMSKVTGRVQMQNSFWSITSTSFDKLSYHLVHLATITRQIVAHLIQICMSRVTGSRSKTKVKSKFYLPSLTSASSTIIISLGTSVNHNKTRCCLFDL